MKTKLKTNCSNVRMFGMFECGRVVRSIIAVALCAVGLSAFAAPAEISAVSEEGWLDLTVGDRVATNEETIVVDPAWGNAETATVKLQNGWMRTYTCASNDLWDTTALTPGRYTLALTAGATNETAAFWKTGDDWVVLNLTNYNEGIEFQTGTTYLVLNAAMVPDNKKLTVVDGAKFEYGAGAGFIGGQLEMPRRYRKEVVEGDLYRIVEAIKGCEDNPWEVGVGVEAYTNGTDNLVIVGTGTITDLSDIPDAVKNGIRAITVTEATVKGAEDGAFTGFNNIAVTLPDGWQGKLPDKDGNWYDATDANLTAYPMAVKNVKILQRYPWNGLVDVTYDLTGVGNVKVVLSVTANGKMLANPTVTGVKKFDLGTGGEVKGLKLVWDAKADFGDEGLHEKIKVKLYVSPVE